MLRLPSIPAPVAGIHIIFTHPQHDGLVSGGSGASP
jgi:hypothetical protein